MFEWCFQISFFILHSFLFHLFVSRTFGSVWGLVMVEAIMKDIKGKGLHIHRVQDQSEVYKSLSTPCSHALLSSSGWLVMQPHSRRRHCSASGLPARVWRSVPRAHQWRLAFSMAPALATPRALLKGYVSFSALFFSWVIVLIKEWPRQEERETLQAEDI